MLGAAKDDRKSGKSRCGLWHSGGGEVDAPTISRSSESGNRRAPDDPGQLVDRLEDEIERLLGQIAEEFSADAVTFLLNDHEADQFDLPIQHGLLDPESFVQRAAVPGPDRLAGKIVREKQPVFAEEVYGHPDVDEPFTWRERIVSAAALPLVQREEGEERAFGVLFIGFRRRHIFSSQDHEEMTQCADRIAEKVSDSPVFSALRKRRSDDPAKPEPDEALQEITNLAYTLSNMPTGIWLRRPSSEEFAIRAANGLTFAYVAEASAKIGDESIIGEVLKTFQATEIVDIYSDPRFPYTGLAKRAGWKSTLALPIKLRGRVSGVIQLFSYTSERFKFREYESLRRLAKMARIAIESTYRADESREFTTLAKDLSSKTGFDSAMRDIVEYARNLTNADSSTIILLDERSDHFIIGSRSPAERPTTVPRSEGGLTKTIMKTGESIRIDDTEQDPRVKPELRDQGIRALIGVRLELEGNRFGVLYVDGRRPFQFTDWDERILRKVADYASIAPSWTRRLLTPWRSIEEATSNLFHRDAVLESFCEDIQRELKFDFALVHLIRREKKIIEAVHGVGRAAKWIGRSRHYLHEKEDLCDMRDIQADIALARPLRTEIIKGWDKRFDEGLYKEFQHQDLVRVFSPLVIVRDEAGRSIEGWLDKYDWEVITEERQDEGLRTVIKMGPNPSECKSDKIEIEVIGTIEAGYEDANRALGPDQAQELVEFSVRHVKKIRSALLRHILETIVEQACQIVDADSASIHFSYDEEQNRYLWQARSGLDFGFLKRRPPTRGGLGRTAVKEKKVKLIPDPVLGQDESAFADLKPALSEDGIKAMAAFPLFIEDQDGVLYLHFRKDHFFTNDEVGWVQLFADRAVDAIRHVMAFSESRDKARQLDTLQAVAQDLVSNLEESGLLLKIAWSALNTLAADVVTIYGYNENEKRFHFPPKVAGRLIEKDSMRTKIKPDDAPARLIDKYKYEGNLYVEEDIENNDILNRKEGKSADRETFVAREKTVSAAGILLKVADEIVGVMFVNYRRPHRFTVGEKSIINAFASVAAIAIKNQRLLEKRQEDLEKRQEDLMVITHHLQGPLVAVSGTLSRLRKVSEATSQLADNVRIPVSRSFSRKLDDAHALTEDILAMSHGIFTSFAREVGREISLDTKVIDAPKKVRDLCERMRITNDRPDLDFKYEEDSDFPELYFDRDTFNTVMYNLIHNALKYSLVGSPVHITCRCDKTSNKARITVKSTGARINEVEKETIFSKFQKGEIIEETGRHHSGVGLGLWSARESMRATGGDILLELSRTEPQRASFIVEIPLLAE